MRIRRSTTPSVSLSPHHNHHPSPSPSPSSCSSSSSSSCFSSSQHSTISSHSLTSSSNSTSSSSSPSRRCEGLDLLVKAVYFVAGSIVGVPYIQKRVIRRRKPALRFSNLVITSVRKQLRVTGDNEKVEDETIGDCCSNLLQQHQQLLTTTMAAKTKKITKKKTAMTSDDNNNHSSTMIKRRSKGVPVKYQDSVLQSWKSNTLRRRRSTKV